MKSLVILRGLPSSGKTTFAELLETRAICSADDYHYRNGKYRWKPENIKSSHDWCQKKCKRFMDIECQKIVIANTNTTEDEMQPYQDLADMYGYRVFYIVVERRHGNTNNHNVPNEAVERMRERFKIML